MDSSITAASPLPSPSSASTFSSPLSRLSRTPSLPNSPVIPPMKDEAARRYPSPSPTSTTTSGSQSPSKQLSDPIGMPSDGSTPAGSDGPPPAKKRKTAAPKERTTEYLDLMKEDPQFNEEDKRQLERLKAALHKKKKIVVIAGAGISVSAGIPDFRSSNGLFATARSQHKVKASGKHLFDASVYKHNSSTQSFHTMVREMAQMSQEAKPTQFHLMLASLAQQGRLLRLYSQNIDCLDTSLEPLATNIPLNPKGPWPATVQLHGGLQKMVCTKCSELSPFDGTVFDGPEAPLCPSCIEQDQVRTAHAGKRSHGIGRLRPRFVLYNEFNPDEEAIGNVSSADLKARPDAVIVVGTTLKVPGTRRLVKELCQVTRGRRDGFTAWINIESEPKGIDFKDCWDLVVKAKCDDVAREVNLDPWDFTLGEDYLVSKEQDVEIQERCTKFTINVDIPTVKSEDESADPKQKVLQDVQQHMPTPGASPTISAVKPATKIKQSKLSFGKHTGTSAEAGSKAPAKRGRKPNSKKATKEASKQTVTNHFKIEKVADRSLSGKPGMDDIKSTNLPELRPERKRPLSPSFTWTPETPETPEKITETLVVSDIPTTPEQQQLSLPPSQHTISPKSVPKGMGTLIDVE
ncbi:hypothetical protein NLU13_3810 [Sarocladium strictum]|uniref:Deacetylase sirtuin-type domain-containing protein n=1 Tax=Sarocladium strictum TaxID=5046 RepID=A0AA39GJE5_SARSR|nr:hypothetical protein NLU13_3810 [Sarocladium strictum]